MSDVDWAAEVEAALAAANEAAIKPWWAEVLADEVKRIQALPHEIPDK